MFSTQTAEISLDAPCRALAAVRGADHSETRFLVGSCSVPAQQSNSLYLLRFHPEVNELGIDARLSHDAGPVGQIVSCPGDASLVLTYAENSRSATLSTVPKAVLDQHELHHYDPDDETSVGASVSQMQNAAILDCGGPLVDVAWRDGTNDDIACAGNIVTLERDGTVSQWDASRITAESVRKSTGTTRGKLSEFPPRVAWDPHGNGDSLAVSDGNAVRLLDWRVDTSVPAGTVDTFLAHRSAVTGLDYNPNKPYVMATSGQDGLLKFFDLRAAKHPLLVARGGHSHWVWNVRYNPFHDQLVLSSGSDSLANLWRVSSISSAPLLTLTDDNVDDDDDGASDTAAPNVRVSRHEHGDSVYGAAWSSVDPWIYLTLSYDGKAMLNHVPSKEKYKILL